MTPRAANDPRGVCEWCGGVGVIACPACRGTGEPRPPNDLTPVPARPGPAGPIPGLASAAAVLQELVNVYLEDEDLRARIHERILPGEGPPQPTR